MFNGIETTSRFRTGFFGSVINMERTSERNARDFFTNVLAPYPPHRLTAEKALAHPYFTGSADKIEKFEGRKKVVATDSGWRETG